MAQVARFGPCTRYFSSVLLCPTTRLPGRSVLLLAQLHGTAQQMSYFRRNHFAHSVQSLNSMLLVLRSR